MSTYIKSFEHIKEFESKRSTIFYGYHSTLFGECLIAYLQQGICHLSFLHNADRSAIFSVLEKQFKNSNFIEDQVETRHLVDKIFNPAIQNAKDPIKIFMFGTAFQLKVWKALLTIEFGERVSYEKIANLIGQPKAIRAAATAIAKNKIAFLIPCHRVISKSGKINKYRWGTQCKAAILEYELNNK